MTYYVHFVSLFVTIATSKPSRSSGEFFSQKTTLCADSYSVSVPSPSYRSGTQKKNQQQQQKKPGHSAKSAGGRLHLNTLTPLTQRSRSGLTMPLSRHNVETYPETSSHATCQGTFGHGRLSSVSYCGLILALTVELVRASQSPVQGAKKSAGRE